jgi:hypothetical protein
LTFNVKLPTIPSNGEEIEPHRALTVPRNSLDCN